MYARVKVYGQEYDAAVEHFVESVVQREVGFKPVVEFIPESDELMNPEDLLARRAVFEVSLSKGVNTENIDRMLRHLPITKDVRFKEAEEE